MLLTSLIVFDGFKGDDASPFESCRRRLCLSRFKSIIAASILAIVIRSALKPPAPTRRSIMCCSPLSLMGPKEEQRGM